MPASKQQKRGAIVRTYGVQSKHRVYGKAGATDENTALPLNASFLDDDTPIKTHRGICATPDDDGWDDSSGEDISLLLTARADEAPPCAPGPPLAPEKGKSC